MSIKTTEAYNLGTWMGRKQAFTSLAGRCSAADAECLRQIRDQKQYRALRMIWAEFRKRRVGLARVTRRHECRRGRHECPRHER